ncbi:MAG: hypothetical protein EOO41_02465, partial [Methanobacteriota archaeon]
MQSCDTEAVAMLSTDVRAQLAQSRSRHAYNALTAGAADALSGTSAATALTVLKHFATDTVVAPLLLRAYEDSCHSRVDVSLDCLLAVVDVLHTSLSAGALACNVMANMFRALRVDAGILAKAPEDARARLAHAMVEYIRREAAKDSASAFKLLADAGFVSSHVVEDEAEGASSSDDGAPESAPVAVTAALSEEAPDAVLNRSRDKIAIPFVVCMTAFTVLLKSGGFVTARDLAPRVFEGSALLLALDALIAEALRRDRREIALQAQRERRRIVAASAASATGAGTLLPGTALPGTPDTLAASADSMHAAALVSTTGTDATPAGVGSGDTAPLADSDAVVASKAAGSK